MRFTFTGDLCLHLHTAQQEPNFLFRQPREKLLHRGGQKHVESGPHPTRAINNTHSSVLASETSNASARMSPSTPKRLNQRQRYELVCTHKYTDASPKESLGHLRVLHGGCDNQNLADRPRRPKPKNDSVDSVVTDHPQMWYSLTYTQYDRVEIQTHERLAIGTYAGRDEATSCQKLDIRGIYRGNIRGDSAWLVHKLTQTQACINA
ncbi:hypothetical protein EDD22DRAFT_847000 [Suillus occidentalis]|nr:hypothetical protein EDD22DRAFT_847000 [Suillus occidentalis]